MKKNALILSMLLIANPSFAAEKEEAGLERFLTPENIAKGFVGAATGLVGSVAMFFSALEAEPRKVKIDDYPATPAEVAEINKAITELQQAAASHGGAANKIVEKCYWASRQSQIPQYYEVFPKRRPTTTDAMAKCLQQNGM